MLSLEKLAPFMVRAHIVEVGRDRLAQVKNRLAFLLITEDISEKSRQQARIDFHCPVFQCLTSTKIEELFGYRNTKMIGIHRSPLADSIIKDLAPYKLGVETDVADKLPQHPKVAVLGASGIGKYHCNWWTMEGAPPVAFLGSSAESVATTQAMLQDSCNFQGKGYHNLQQLLEEAQPDIVDVCLPVELHYPAAKTALEANCHLLCEKPFVYDKALSFSLLRDQARELTDLAAARKRLLCVSTQYAVAAQKCLELFRLNTSQDYPDSVSVTICSPAKGRTPDPVRTWVDLAPHALAVTQVICDNGRADWKSLDITTQGHQICADFICRRHGKHIPCPITLTHKETEPASIRQITFNDKLSFHINGFKDQQGIFGMELKTAWGSVRSEDMLRLLIRDFLSNKADVPPRMALRNQDWLLTVLENLENRR